MYVTMWSISIKRGQNKVQEKLNSGPSSPYSVSSESTNLKWCTTTIPCENASVVMNGDTGHCTTLQLDHLTGPQHHKAAPCHHLAWEETKTCVMKWLFLNNTAAEQLNGGDSPESTGQEIRIPLPILSNAIEKLVTRERMDGVLSSPLICELSNGPKKRRQNHPAHRQRDVRLGS